ncbi:protein DOP1A-like [Ptychodera flava]|uniref:protein DOP1A-like n=1 Tax=Ptychodera flava TaxID=63121 RepID=UPI00396A09A1
MAFEVASLSAAVVIGALSIRKKQMEENLRALMASLHQEESEWVGDAKYRAYVAAVEKALKNFEYSSEWADLISALGKLNKVLQANSKYPVIPKRLLIGKRLAQCTHPALPSGVHLRALETYDIIFKNTGSKRLAQDLFLYSAGLFPLLGNAAMSVKPVLLSLYEEHYLPLGEHLKPGLNGLLLGILPGLEEGSEYYERTNSLLEQVCGVTDRISFHTALWDCVLSSPIARLPAITFVLSYVSKSVPLEGQLYFMGNDTNRMVTAISASLHDSSVLVQRSMLDFLLQCLPMHAARLEKEDTVNVVMAALNVVLRRDMSLNRRLYAWLLGGDSNSISGGQDYHPRLRHADSISSSITTISEEEASYFDLHSKEFLIESLKLRLHDDELNTAWGSGGEKIAALKPYRILISLLDKPEIGAAILEDILIEVFRSLYLHCLSSNVEQEKSARKRRPKSRRQRRSKEEKGSSELIKTANLLFSTFEPFFLWDYIARQFDACCRLKRVMSDEDSIAHGKVTVRELCKLVDFLLDVVSLETYMETQTEHLPELLCQITMSMSNHCLVLDVSDINAGLNLCAKILTKVLPSMATTPADGGITQSGEFQEAATATLESSVREAKVMQVADEETVDEKPSEAVVMETPGASPDEEILEEIKEETREVNGENGDDDSTTVGDEEKFDPEQLEEDEIPIDRMDETNVSWNDTDSSRDGSKISSKDGKEFVNQAMQSTEDAIMKAGKITPIANAAQDGEEEGEESESESESETEEESQSESSATMSGQSGEPSEKGEQEAASTMSVAEQEKEQTPLFLMQACMQCYQNCFAKFITTKILPCSEIVGTCMEYITTSGNNLRTTSDSPEEEPLGEKHTDSSTVPTGGTLCTADVLCYGSLLFKRVHVSGCWDMYVHDSSSHPHYHPSTGYRTERDIVFLRYGREAVRLDGSSLPKPHIDAFITACQLLVEFSCFPLYCDESITASQLQEAINKDGTSLPEWLQALITCSCFVSNFEIQSTAAATMLDLINLTRSVAIEPSGKSFVPSPPSSPPSTGPGKVAVVIVPAIAQVHLDYITENTMFFQLVARNLWGWLSAQTPQYHQKTADLFYQLHSVAPSMNICEDVIGRSLLHEDKAVSIEGHVKFALLWHLIRGRILSVSPSTIPRTFDRSMLNVLDHLYDTDSITKAVVTTWLTHAIERGDIARILEPMLLILLHPKTARVSVQFLRLNSTDALQAQLHIQNEEERAKDDAYDAARDGYGESPTSMEKHSLSSDSGSEYSSQAAASSATGSKAKRVAGSSESLPEDGASTTARGETDDPESIYGGAMFEPEAYSYSHDQRRCTSERHYRWQEMDERELKDEDTTVSRTTEMDSHIDDDYHGHSADDEAGDEFEWDNFETKLSELDTEHSDPDSPRRHISMASLTSDTKRALNSVHPLHQHMLMYKQVYDSRRSIYVLTALRNILQVIPRTFVCAASSTSISSIHTPHLATLQNLLARHRRSIVGKSFYDDLPQEALASFRSNTYLEIMVSVCMYFIRGYYPKYMPATSDDIRGNKDVQILSIEIMTKILAELVQVVKESGKGTATFIKDLMSRCKVQKAILHCLLATVLNARKQALRQYSAGFNMSDKSSQAVQIHLLQLVLTVMVLEEQLFSLKDGSDRSPTDNEGIGEWEHVRPNFQQPMSSLRFIQSERVASQGMFLCAILSALRQPHMSHVHRQWVSIVTDGLPYMDKGLGNIVVPVANQLCKNLESLAYLYDRNGGFQRDKRPMTKLEYIPPDHAVTLLEGLTTMCHYCLLESTTNLSAVSSRHGVTTSASDTESVNPAQLLSNLFGALSGDKHKGAAASTSTQSANPVTEARKGLLGILPRIMSAVAVLWSAITTCENEESRSGSYQREAKKANWVIGTPRAVRQQILEFLSPIALHHGINLLGAIGVVWSDRRKLNRPVVGTRKVIVIPQANEEQTLLVELVSAIKAMPTDTVIQTIRHVMKGPPYTIKDKNQPSLEVNILQFFYQFVQRSSSSQLLDSWQTLLSLLRESLQLNLPPTGQFLLFGILNEFIMKLTGFADRKYQKDLQEIAQKLIENIYHIAGSSLGQTRWLRRQRSVIPIPQDGYIEDLDLEESLPAPQIEISTTKSGRHDVPPPTSASSSPTTQVAFSVQALTLLAENLSIMLDIIYGSEEKEKVVPLLTQIMQNVTPYLRNHSSANMPAFRSCVSLLSSLSGYQYTRKAWRKDTIELLMDQSFFQMDAICINGFRSIIDNLMTHDKTTYRDLMSKVAAINNSTSLNLFTNKEQEMDQRAQLLKRLSFSIFCSEVDQYQKFLPDIQERLVENLRLTNVPNVHEQVFMCFRVLLLRMSPQHLTGLWPTMISEMVQVFLHIEEQLFGGGENTGRPKDAPIFPILNGSPTIYQKQWLGLYLSACKLLDLALVLPVENMPQFQLYKWAFIGDNSGLDMLKKQFVPHIARLAHLINKKVSFQLDNTEELTLIKSIPGRPLLTMYSIKSIGQLQQFFNTLCHIHQLGGSLASLSLSQSSTALQESQQLSQSQDRPYRHIRRDSITSVTSKADDHESRSSTSPMQFIERMIERDFLDPLVQ